MAKRKNPAAVALGRRGGAASSPAKAAAARRNALKGGRRTKFQIGERVRANDKAPLDYEGRRGTITEIGPGRTEYGVRFEPDPPKADTGYLMSWWLDPIKG